MVVYLAHKPQKHKTNIKTNTSLFFFFSLLFLFLLFLLLCLLFIISSSSSSSQIDKDGSNEISLDEFIAWHLAPAPGSAPANITSVLEAAGCMMHLTAFVQNDLITLDVLQDVVADEAMFKDVAKEIGLNLRQRLEVKKAILDAVDEEKLRLEALKTRKGNRRWPRSRREARGFSLFTPRARQTSSPRTRRLSPRGKE